MLADILSEEFGEGKGLFNFIVDETARKSLIEAYDRVRDRVREDLKRVAVSNRCVFPISHT